MHRRGPRARASHARTVRNHCQRGDRAGQSAGGRIGLADDHPDAAEDRLRRARRGAPALARRRRHPVHQLGGKTVLDGAPGFAVHRPSVRAMAAVGANSVLYRRPHSAGGSALHGDGVRVVEPVRGRAALHPEPGRAQRRHHGVRVRAIGRALARRRLDRGAMGHAADLGRAVYRRARHRGASVAAGAAGQRAGGAAADPAGSATGVAGRAA